MHDKVFFAAFEVAGHGKACFSGSAWMDTKGLSDLVRSPHALVGANRYSFLDLDISP
jgi:hypothetical protein